MTLSAMKEFSAVSVKEIDMLSVHYGINKSGAIDFALRCKWIVKDDIFHFTERGEAIIKEFDGFHISLQMWMSILYDYISLCCPSWGALIPSGRKEAYFFMPSEAQRCFRESGLLRDSSSDVVEWWDTLAGLYRSTNESKRIEIGRKGESLTMQYEALRTGSTPFWESLDSNKAGYDIISIVDSGSDRSLYIEVKASEQSIESSCAFITRNEWDVANNHLQEYKFYFWLLGRQNYLAIVDPEQLEPHLPRDVGEGRWKEAEVPFRSFASLFVAIA